MGILERDYIKGFIQNPYRDYRHVLDIFIIKKKKKKNTCFDIKTILGFGINCKSREEIT